MRARILKLTLALSGLAGGVYAADLATAPETPDLAQTINAQRAAEGQPIGGPSVEHQATAYTPDQMLDLAQNYDKDMRRTIDHAQDVRITAYRSRDIIRMTCVDDKLTQIKMVIDIAQPRYLTMRTFKTAELVMREQFSIISQAHDRVAELSTQVDGCLGDDLNAVQAGQIQEQEQPSSIPGDPTQPGSPIIDVQRPPEASPYN